MNKTKPVMAITFNKPLTKEQRDTVLDYLSEVSEKTGYYAVVTEDASVTFDCTAALLEEQRITNQLLRDLLQANTELIEALGEPEQADEPERDLDGNRRAVACSKSAYMDTL